MLKILGPFKMYINNYKKSFIEYVKIYKYKFN